MRPARASTVIVLAPALFDPARVFPQRTGEWNWLSSDGLRGGVGGYQGTHDGRNGVIFD